MDWSAVVEVSVPSACELLVQIKEPKFEKRGEDYYYNFVITPIVLKKIKAKVLFICSL